jgi:molecular chaperone DnaK (HSP70)
MKVEVNDGAEPSAHNPSGLPEAFDIDVNGHLDVSAKDLATGKEQGIEAKASSEALAGDTQPASE